MITSPCIYIGLWKDAFNISNSKVNASELLILKECFIVTLILVNELKYMNIEFVIKIHVSNRFMISLGNYLGVHFENTCMIVVSMFHAKRVKRRENGEKIDGSNNVFGSAQ